MGSIKVVAYVGDLLDTWTHSSARHESSSGGVLNISSTAKITQFLSTSAQRGKILMERKDFDESHTVSWRRIRVCIRSFFNPVLLPGAFSY